ncbi:hypothetical protein M0R04_10055 [Candidatus Dojkabacteria bacterium]|jgi:hypothetical protein|nr:hypothetical protein [Candidatus Dojkabacteria bacterium]
METIEEYQKKLEMSDYEWNKKHLLITGDEFVFLLIILAIGLTLISSLL